MKLDQAFDESDELAEQLEEITDIPLLNDSDRIRVSDVACSLSLEHWHAVRALLRAATLPSALVVHRAQFEAITRSVWLTYAAPESSISKLVATLDLVSEQAAKSTPQLLDMLHEIENKGPPQAHQALMRFKEYNWKALNSYAHAGIHPLRRHQDGYPVALIHGSLCNSNGLAVISCMQAVVLGGEQPLQRKLLDVAARYPGCMPQSL